MKPRSGVRVVVCVLGAIAALAACKAASGPNANSPSGGGGSAIAMAKPVLFEDEKPVGKIVAFKDGEELKSFNDAWLEDVNGGERTRPAFFKRAGKEDEEDAGVPKGGGKGGQQGQGATKGPPTPSTPAKAPPHLPAAKPAPAGAAPSPQPAAT